MAGTKYTKEGKKVAVLGKLNNEEWIVQEIFVAEGKEFPAGENFTTKTLLDKPAETYYDRRRKELEGYAKRLEAEIASLQKKTAIARRKETAARLINYATKKYADIDLSQLDILLGFMAGEITHLVVEHWHEYSIVSLIDGVEATDSSGYGHIRSDGLRLVSLFGCNEYGRRYDKDTALRLDWRINQYRDGSGHSWDTVYPCKSFDDAVAKLDERISQEEKATEKLIETKKLYNLAHPTDDKIAVYRQAVIESKKCSVKKAQNELDKTKSELDKAEKALIGLTDE